MQRYNSKFFNLLENYNSILYKKRMFFPRNFNLSPEFIKALQKEIERLKKENFKKNQIIEKLSKALHFFC